MDSSGGLIVRSLKTADLERLVRMDERYTGRRRKAWFEGKLLRALSETDVKISLGAEVDGRLAGALMGSVHYGEFGLPEPVAILDTILVDPDRARKGVASVLFRQLLRNLRALNVETLRTEVSSGEKDLARFLEKQGFIAAPRKVLELAVGKLPDMDVDEAELASNAITPEDSPARPR